jgi:hypothetical protein
MGADEYREFARMQQLRFERFLREFREDSIRRHEAVMRKLDEESAKTDRLLEESKAHTGALLAILDRMNGGGAEPAT